MAEADEIAIPFAVSQMLRGMMAGEREVEAQSIVAAARQARAMYPHRYLVRQMRGELNFEASLESTVRFLWYKRTDVRPATTVQVRMAFEPSLDPPLPVPVSRELVMAVPRFLERADDREALRLTLADERILRVDFGARSEQFLETIGFSVDGNARRAVSLVAAVREGGTIDEDKSDWTLLADWPMGIIVALLETIAEWRLGRMSARNARFDLAGGIDDPRLHQVLGTILDGCRQVTGDLQGTAAEAPAGRVMQLSLLTATMQVHLDSHGSVATSRDRPESSQQLDLAVTPGGVTDDQATLITFDLPDFLVRGELRDEVLGELRTHEERDRIAKALRDGHTDDDAMLSQEQISALLEAGRQPGNGIVIRAGHGRRRQDGDTDLVLLKDDTGPDHPGLLLEVRFRQSERTTETSVEEISNIYLVAHRRRGVWQGSRPRLFGPFALQAPHYFARLLRTLHTLQQCVAAGLEARAVQ